ncbi:hypothetical protein [Mycolicibacterium baixiangningiae]|uniref:hypothetical protein n=1 Tax=Mycolicibacterium baixiangningiae TaxID=2761578 RepID=UPI0018682363|nr:hypothetical protein [Mycolicibacterium baixiangningiae]
MSDACATKRAAYLLAFSAVALIIAFILARLPLSGPVGAYEFARGNNPSDRDVLIARIQVVASIVAAVCSVGFYVAAVDVKESRALIALGVIGVFVGLAYVLLILFVLQVAF